MISITNRNLAGINHKVHRGARWRSQILEGSGREKKIHVSSVLTKVCFQLVDHKRKGFSGIYRLKVSIFQKKS